MKHGNRVSSSTRRSFATSALLAGLATFLIGHPLAVRAADPFPYNYALVDIFDGSIHDGTTVVGPQTASALATRGSSPTAVGTSVANYGSNGFALTAGSSALSVWVDSFTAPNYNGTAYISVHISGSIQIDGDMSYTLFASPVNVFSINTILEAVTIDDVNPSIAGASRIIRYSVQHPNQDVSVNILRTPDVPINFTAGATYYLASVFGGDVHVGGGSENFLNSATFHIEATGLSQVCGASGTCYTAAVPEPGTWMLLAAGLLGLIVATRRRSRAG